MASLTTEPHDIMIWKSELRVVAEKSGNADGAKARRSQDSTTGEQGPDTEPGNP